jgi:hypothetical protein
MDLPPPLPEKRYWVSSFIASGQIRLCLLVLLAVALLPPEKGLGVDLCMMQRLTGAPCPGCGMTRSGSNIIRGHFRRAFDFHPLGFIMHPILFALAGLALLPYAVRARVGRGLQPWRRGIRIISIVFWCVFFAFGAWRWVAVVGGWLTFPPDWLGGRP